VYTATERREKSVSDPTAAPDERNGSVVEFVKGEFGITTSIYGSNAGVGGERGRDARGTGCTYQSGVPARVT
jgi:hypothetical protein